MPPILPRRRGRGADPGDVAPTAAGRIAAMVGVLEGFATIAIIVAVGWLLADRRILDESAQVNLSRLAFYVASPALLLTVMQRTSLDQVLSANLVTSLVSFVVVVAVYLLIARLRWAAGTLGSRLIGSLSA